MTMHEFYKVYFTITLRRYHDLIPESPDRKFIDEVFERSKRTISNDDDKMLHNLATLHWIVDKPLPKSKICKALHIGAPSYESHLKRAFDRLMIIAFGIDGIEGLGEFVGYEKVTVKKPSTKKERVLSECDRGCTA